MTKLEQIDQLLSIYPEYLKYYIEKRVPEITYAQDLMRGYRLTGNMFYHYEECNGILSFDEWLAKRRIPVTEVCIPETVLIEGKKYYKLKCSCPCHTPNRAIIHFIACCNDGFNYRPVNKNEIDLSSLTIVVPKSFIEFQQKYPNAKNWRHPPTEPIDW